MRCSLPTGPPNVETKRRIIMFDDTSLWLMLGSMASTAGLLGFWFEKTAGTNSHDPWAASQLD